jgi:hypothetical protein
VFPCTLDTSGERLEFSRNSSPACTVWDTLFCFSRLPKKAFQEEGELYYINSQFPYTPPVDSGRRHPYLNNLDYYPKFSSMMFMFSHKSLKRYHSFHNSGSRGVLGPDFKVLFFNDMIQELVNYFYLGVRDGKSAKRTVPVEVIYSLVM